VTAASRSSLPDELRVVDSHTEGEPTRMVLDGWPPLPGGTMTERRDALRRDGDALRRAVVREPRGHQAMVGALLMPPVQTG
jgi:4-hydroxyproline epimerase